MLKVQAIPIYTDNYVWMITAGKACYVVDPGDAAPVIKTIESQGLSLQGILITHGHWDHVTGIDALLDYKQVPVYGSERLDHPSLTHPLKEHHELELALDDHLIRANILDTPGHRFDHICYYFAEQAWLFCGDVFCRVWPRQRRNARRIPFLTKTCSPARRNTCVLHTRIYAGQPALRDDR